MLKRIVIVGAFACVGALANESQQPTRPAPQTEKQGQPAKGVIEVGPRGIPPTLWCQPLVRPTLVDTVPGPSKDDGQKPHSKWDEYGKPITDVLLAGATLVLAVFTILLFCATRGLLIEARRQFPHFKRNAQASYRAAKSAAESADALLKSERAYVFARLLSGFPEGRTDYCEHGGPTISKRDIEITFRIKNYGKTPALIVEARCDARVCYAYKEATNPTIRVITGRVLEAAEETDELSERAKIDEADYLRAKQNEGGAMLVVFGEIDFLDVLGDKRASTFAGRYDFQDNMLRITPFGEGNSWT